MQFSAWSVVEATLHCLDALREVPAEISHVTLLSGHDYLLRPVEQLRNFLEQHPDIDHIECVDHDRKK
jgi:hypothetical protein